VPKRQHVLVAVTCAILLTCAGLWFEAIQRVREAAARMSCYGNFKQLTVGLHNSADTNLDKLPPATMPHPDLPPEQRVSWLVEVLPYIEQGNVYRLFDPKRGAGDERNARPAVTRINFFVCPASNEYDRETKTWQSPTPITHRVGIAGVGPDAATLPLKHPRAGFFGYDRQTEIPRGFPDGTSNTLMLIEPARDPGHCAYGGFATVRAFEQGAAPYLGEGRPFGGFHGNHWLGARQRTDASADSSVRSFTPKTDPALLESLATVAGKEELPAEW
jgi:hypothetical protein